MRRRGFLGLVGGTLLVAPKVSITTPGRKSIPSGSVGDPVIQTTYVGEWVAGVVYTVGQCVVKDGAFMMFDGAEFIPVCGGGES